MLIEKRKWDGTVSARWEAELRRDGDRVVFVTPAGTRRERPRTGEVEVTRRREASASGGAGWIVTAFAAGDGEPARYTVDATMGDERPSGGMFAFIDLDLDLEIADGEVVVEDLLQFAQRRRTMGYPAGLLTHAAAALGDALDRHRRGAWPFDGSLLDEAAADAPRRPGAQPRAHRAVTPVTAARGVPEGEAFAGKPGIRSDYGVDRGIRPDPAP